MMGLGGGVAFEGFFFRNAPLVHEKILNAVGELINQSLNNAVRVTTDELIQNKKNWLRKW